MNFDKAIIVDDFIRLKETQRNTFFSVNVDFLHDSNHWIPFGQSELQIQNSVSKDDYTFIFMDDLIGTKPYLGHFQFDMNYIDDIEIEGKYLYFSHDGKRVRLY